MTTDKLKGLVVLGSFITAIGIILLFFSVYFGTSLAENWLSKQGTADTSIYLIVIKGFINNFITAGGILFGIGLATIISLYCKILNIKE